MRHKNYILAFFFALAAFAAGAQTCPGPAQRQALINMQRANVVNGTRAYQFIMTDTCGNQRYILLDSLIVLVVDSIAADTALQRNWYTHDGTTTNPLRTATIDSAAQWIGNNADGFLYWEIGTLAGGRAYIDTDESSIFFGDLGGVNTVEANTTGIDITTSATASRAVDLITDTLNMIGSFDATNFRENFLSDYSYLYADSAKVVGIGQFPVFPALAGDGTDKGFLYDALNNGVIVINGEGISGTYSAGFFGSNGDVVFQTQTDAGDESIDLIIQTSIGSNRANNEITLQSGQSEYGGMNYLFTAGQTLNLWGINTSQLDTNFMSSLYFGKATTGNNFYIGRRAWGARVWVEETPFDYIQSYLPNDTTENAVSFYNHAYFWKNEHPTGAAGDTLFHFWAATGAGGEAGADPGFMTLDSIRGPGGGTNWYVSDGITTDNHRIADVLGQATWRSDDATLDGLVPFRWEITGVMNEPEMMVWYFDNTADSLLLAHSDVEILLNSSTSFIVSADAALSLLSDATVSIGADSLIINNGTLQADDEGDILVVAGADASNRTVRYLEGTFDAEMLSWAAGAAGDNWEAVPANRWSIASTSASLIPSISVPNILIDGAGGGTVQLNYTPAMPSGSYTTIRYIYNSTAAATTVSTDQAWQFRSEAGDLGASFSLGAGQAATLIWIYNATAANARFFVVFSDGLTNWTESFSSATQATSAFTATNAATNVNAAIIPKGTGAFVLNMPDGGTGGGNSRGANAVDLQTSRDAATQVASGDRSFIGGGRRNTASGAGSATIGGADNIASGQGAVVIGGYTTFASGGANVVSGSNAGAWGIQDTATGVNSYAIGSQCVASADYSLATNAISRAYLEGQRSNAAATFDADLPGTAQTSYLIMSRQITGTAQTELFLDGSTVQAILLGTNRGWNFKVDVVGICNNAGNGIGITTGDVWTSWHVGGIKRLNTTTSLVGTVQTPSTAQADAGMTTTVVTVDADDSTEALRIRITPPTTAGTTTVTRWVATISLTEVAY